MSLAISSTLLVCSHGHESGTPVAGLLLRPPAQAISSSDSVLTRSPSFSSLPRTARASSTANEPTTAGCQRLTRSWLAAPSSAPTIPRRVRLTSDKVLQLPSPPAWPDHDTLRTPSVVFSSSSQICSASCRPAYHIIAPSPSRAMPNECPTLVSSFPPSRLFSPLSVSQPPISHPSLLVPVVSSSDPVLVSVSPSSCRPDAPTSPSARSALVVVPLTLLFPVQFPMDVLVSCVQSHSRFS